jgi:TRAP-type uncharacterized transport system substrate-binding protein
LSKRSRHIVWVVANASRILAGIVGLSIIAILFTSRPTTHLTIEAGTKGGLFDVMAQDLKESLAPQGIDVEVVNRPDSLRIIDDIADEESPVDAGFIASDVPDIHYDRVQQLGTVMLAPVYLVTRLDSDIRELTDFRNRTISLYPEGSAAWDACQYILLNYDIPYIESRTEFGNGEKVIANVANGVTETGCLIDIPPGVKFKYADAILYALGNSQLRFIQIPQAAALQAKKDFLRPVTVPSGSFSVNPPRPAEDLPSTAASITFVAKNDLPRELVIMISNALAQQYRGSTASNQAGELPTTSYINLPAFRESTNIYSNDLPWLYRNFSYGTAGFLDKFFGRYGIMLTALFIVLSFTSLFGLPTPYGLVVGTRPWRMKVLLDGINHRIQQSGSLSKSDARKLDIVERWLTKETSDLQNMEESLRAARSHAKDDPSRRETG